MTERLRRMLCRFLGHRRVIDDRGEPVTRFWVCLRCGRFGR